MTTPRVIKTTTKDFSIRTGVRLNLTQEEHAIMNKAAFKDGKVLGKWARERLLKLAKEKMARNTRTLPMQNKTEDNQVMRDEFEKWANCNGYYTGNEEGNYFHDETIHAWNAWQAALKQPNNNPEAKVEL